MTYAPTWESLDSRPCPAWFDDAKFGIFIHWGLYSVPAWGPKGQYAEWYWNAMANRDGETWKFHAKTYGEGFRYQDFVSGFRAELFEPEKWANLFKRAGARYVALTSKHHDGFCLWQSPHSWNWNSVDVGPHRDLLSDLTEAGRAAGLKMGFYYSLYEWHHPDYRTNLARYVDRHMLPQLKQVIERYEPAILFSDCEWEHPADSWRSREFLAWLYNESPCRDEIVANDRWGSECRSSHGDYFTTEYGHVGGGKSLAEGKKWEENRGIGRSFGYNRNEDVEDYLTGKQLVHMLVELVAKGGNLLLNVGPTADGRIPVIMQERLLELGRWLDVNGGAIYGSRSWRQTGEEGVYYTTRDGAVYAIALGLPGRELALTAPKPTASTTVTLLGREGNLSWKSADGAMRIELPILMPHELPSQHAYVFRLTGVS
ncbi:alpha-L-fucosidase [Candidatus Poribacteria bacterium]|nr:alpha-L-fucosidase [Candidatus Poribacteria bacterium]